MIKIANITMVAEKVTGMLTAAIVGSITSLTWSITVSSDITKIIHVMKWVSLSNKSWRTVTYSKNYVCATTIKKSPSYVHTNIGQVRINNSIIQ